MPKLNDSWFLTKVELDLSDRQIHTLKAHESDANGRGISLTVYQDGKPADLSGMSVYLEWRTSIGTEGINQFEAVNASQGEFKITYPSSMQIPGVVTARISIYINEDTPITGSLNFEIVVEKSPIDDEVAEGDNDFSIFVKAVNDLNNIEGNLKEAEAERERAEQQRVQNEAGRVAAEDKRSTAEKSRETAEKKRESQEASRVQAESERASAELERVKAEIERANAEAQRIANELERISAESQRVLEQAKNNADQALNNELASKMQPYICQTGEYDSKFKPTISDPVSGRLYLVPTGKAGDDKYIEWLYTDGTWEQVGTSGGEPYSVITTDQIDQALGEGATGDSLLSLTGLTYVWEKIKNWGSTTFRKITDKINGTDITDSTISKDKLDSALKTELDSIPEIEDISEEEVDSIVEYVPTTELPGIVEFINSYKSFLDEFDLLKNEWSSAYRIDKSVVAAETMADNAVRYCAIKNIEGYIPIACCLNVTSSMRNVIVSSPQRQGDAYFTRLHAVGSSTVSFGGELITYYIKQ